MDHLFRYENQTGLVKFLEERLSTKIETTRENVSPEMALELDASVAAKLRRKYTEDFDLWEGLAAS